MYVSYYFKQRVGLCALVIEKSIPIPWIPLEFQFHSKELEWNWN
jgi:hypothetical protein